MAKKNVGKIFYIGNIVFAFTNVVKIKATLKICLCIANMSVNIFVIFFDCESIKFMELNLELYK